MTILFLGHSPKSTCQAISSGPSTTAKELSLDGDIILGGLFPVHRRSKTAEHQCDKIDLQPGYQLLVAMLFALEEINNNTNILPNITLGAKIYDTCRSQTIGMDRAKDFIKYTLLPESDKTPPLAGVIGAFRSDVSIAVSNLLRVFDIPQVKPFTITCLHCCVKPSQGLRHPTKKIFYHYMSSLQCQTFLASSASHK